MGLFCNFHIPVLMSSLKQIPLLIPSPWDTPSHKYGRPNDVCQLLNSHHGAGRASQVALVVKTLPVNAGDARDSSSMDPWVGKILWRRKWQPTSESLPGKFHKGVWWAAVPGGHKESNTTEDMSRYVTVFLTF